MLSDRGVRRILAFLAATLFSTLAATAAAEAPKAGPERPPAWGPTHPVALGGRALFRATDGYALGGIGGHVRLRPFDWIRLELFSDHFLGDGTSHTRHDHEIGFTSQIPVVQSDRLLVYPMLGACAMLAVMSPKESATSRGESQSVDDIRFGVHVGAGTEWALGRGFTLQAQAEAIGYLGHQLIAYDFSARVSPDLKTTLAGQLMAGVNYWF